MKKVIILLILIAFPNFYLNANNISELSELLKEIKGGRIAIQNISTVFLVTCKQLEPHISKDEEYVRIIRPQSSVRESDLPDAIAISKVQAGMVLPFLKKEGEWFAVRLEDGRAGWLHQDDAQLTTTGTVQPETAENTDIEAAYQVRLLADNFYNKFDVLIRETEEKISEFEKIYISLTESDKQNADNLYKELKDELEALRRAQAYTTHYYNKLPPLEAFRAVKGPNDQTIGFSGVASARLGSSAFESGGQISETTRNISFTGNLALSPQSRLTMQLNHNNDVIRTPFTTTDVNAIYSMETSAGTKLRSSLLLQDYRDRLVDNNSFRDLGANVNAEHPLGKKTRIAGDVKAQVKSYPEEDGNNFQGVQFNALVDHKGEKIMINGGIRGRLQSSDIAMLEYRRLMPNLRFILGTVQKNWSIYSEAEQLTYNFKAQSADLTRIRADLERNISGKKTQLSVTSNQYPNNSNYNLLRIKLLRSGNVISPGKIRRSSIYAQYSYYLSNASVLRNYIDLRYDGNFSRNTFYFDIGAFGRYLEGLRTNHRVGLFSRFGLKLSGIQIGPVVGADIIIDIDDPVLTRTGNNFRAGLDGRGNFMIRKATVYSSARYQYTLAYSGYNTEGDPVTRNPMTLEITAGTRIPVARFFDFQFDLRYYSMDFNYEETGEITPVQIQSGLRFLAGISYRF